MTARRSATATAATTGSQGPRSAGGCEAGGGATTRGVHVHAGGGPSGTHLWSREQGLVVPPGNPRGLATAADLAGLRVAERRHGSGTRVLLDRLLRDAGRDPDAVAGPETGSHLETALSVASGIVDAGLGVRSVARALDLDFVPLVAEENDVVLPGDALDAAAPLVAALHDPVTRAAVTALGGYDASRAGQVEDLDT